MNLLSGCERSIVTEYAGTTRDVVEETVLLGGIPLHLADTAGIRATEDPVERIGVDRARERVQAAQLVLAVFDSSQALNEEDRLLIESVQDTPAVAVVNKSDLENVIDLEILKIILNKLYIFRRCPAMAGGVGTGGRVPVEDNELDPSSGILFSSGSATRRGVRGIACRRRWMRSAPA
ncbi:MAG: GTPase [Anaeromassilibacillus sp.]